MMAIEACDTEMAKGRAQLRNKLRAITIELLVQTAMRNELKMIC